MGCDDAIVDVNSEEGFFAHIYLKDNNMLSVSVLNNGKIFSTEVLDISSGKRNHIKIEDYNRDGYKDFSLWHVDEGMGMYKIYRLFLFSQTEKNSKRLSLYVVMILSIFGLMVKI